MKAYLRYFNHIQILLNEVLSQEEAKLIQIAEQMTAAIIRKKLVMPAS